MEAGINLWKTKVGKTSKKISLLRKASKSFLAACAILMLLSTIALYFYTKKLLQKEAEEELYSTESRIENALRLKNVPFSLPPVMEISLVKNIQLESVKDTIIYDPSEDEMEVFRELTTYKSINTKTYRIIVRSLEVESTDILVAVVASYAVIILLTFLFLYYFNTAGNLILWAPFFENLNRMKRFSIISKVPLQLEESDIKEFSELKIQMETLTQKVKSDYENLKQFTEDVSHEMQTPLAIMQAKIENIINGHGLQQKEFEQLTSIQKDIQRLKQLNKRLTLLSKIENNLFVRTELIELNDLITDAVENFSELAHTKITFHKSTPIVVSMDKYLAEALVNNLISNAIKYTVSNGTINIKIEGQTLQIQNLGDLALSDPAQIFNRFYKESGNLQATGLGLAIVKKICELYGFIIDYSFVENQHTFMVTFSNT